MRYPQVKNLDSPASFRHRLTELGVHIPLDDDVDPEGPLAAPARIVDGSAGVLTSPNSFCALPMEGWDGSDGGGSSELVERRWQRFAAGGSGLVWGEATAVRPDGRANPRQLVIGSSTVGDLARLAALVGPDRVVGLQLTHSGRWSRPQGPPSPRTAYPHPILDERVGAGAAAVFTDAELDDLVGAYVAASVLARDAGFAFVDVKHCHGYLLHELLSAHDRPGRYGGSFAGRTRFLRTVVEGIRREAPDLAVAVRLSAFDLVPFVPGPDGRGQPADGGDGRYSYAFGGDGTGTGLDLTEAHRFLDLLSDLGVGLVCVTAGSPYYTPHIQRPAFFPPSDGYRPPEDPLVGVARQISATADLAAAHPDLTVVGSGYSYLQQWVAHVGQAVIGGGGATLVGLGRMLLSYPDLPADVLAGRPLRSKLLCRTFSDCTTAPRAGLVSGCYPLDAFYRERPERATLVQVKKSARSL